MLPIISREKDIIQGLWKWRKELKNSTRLVSRLRAVFNFRASGSTTLTTTILLEWEPLRGADGYIIERSDNGNFANPLRFPVIKGQAAASFPDNVGATGQTRYYRIIATSGTAQNPHSVEGIPSSVISAITNSATTSYDSGSDDAWSTGSEGKFNFLEL